MEKEILNRLLSIEATNENIYREIIKIRRDLDDRRFEGLELRLLIEDVYDFVRLTSK